MEEWDMTGIRQFIPFHEMSRVEQSAHMADDHGLDPEPVTVDELIAEHAVEHRSPHDHAHGVMIGQARPADVSAGRPSSTQEAHVLRTMARLLPGLTREQMDALLRGANALELEPAERLVVYLAPLAAVADLLERARLARAVSEAAMTMAQMAALEANRTRSWAEIGEALGMSRNGAHRWATHRLREGGEQ
jgi:hypothetical protein